MWRSLHCPRLRDRAAECSFAPHSLLAIACEAERQQICVVPEQRGVALVRDLVPGDRRSPLLDGVQSLRVCTPRVRGKEITREFLPRRAVRHQRAGSWWPRLLVLLTEPAPIDECAASGFLARVTRSPHWRGLLRSSSGASCPSSIASNVSLAISSPFSGFSQPKAGSPRLHRAAGGLKSGGSRPLRFNSAVICWWRTGPMSDHLLGQ